MIIRPAFWTIVAHAFRRAALPLAAYYAVTLALPLANGAAASGAAFVLHGLVVLAVPPIIIVLACAVHRILRLVRLAPFTSSSSSVVGTVRQGR